MAAVDDVLKGIAAYAILPKFPWASLESQGKGLLQSDAYVDILDAKFAEYFQVIWRLDIPELQFGGVSADQARGAYEDLADAIAGRASAIYDAISKGNPLLAADQAVEVPADIMRRMLVLTNAVAYADFTAHDTGAYRWAVENGRVTLSDAKDSVESIYRLWDGVVQLEKAGVLNTLKKPEFKATSGLGALPALAWVAIVLVAIAAIAIVAWSLVTLKVESNRLAIMEKTCFDEKTGKLLEPPPPHCGKWLDKLAEDPNSHLRTFIQPLTDAMTAAIHSFAVIAGIGVLFWIGTRYVLPAILDRTGHPAPGAA